ncbi:MAG: hypothetical protein ACFCU6_14130 [Balneolaceae bacterium]
MIDDPKEKNFEVGNQSLIKEKGKNKAGLINRIGILIYSGYLLQLSAAAMMIFLGSAVVAIALLGLMQPLWVSTVLSVAGSVSAMLGLYMLYNLFSDKNTFETLINKAIQRVIRCQN